MEQPSALDEAINFLSCIRKVPGLNLGWDIDYLEGGFSGFSQSFQVNAGIGYKTKTMAAAFHILKFIIHYSFHLS
jgi:hypothetical protein